MYTYRYNDGIYIIISFIPVVKNINILIHSLQVNMSLVEVTSLGNANSTVQNRRSSMKKLNKYLVKRNCPVWADLSREEGENIFCNQIAEYEAIASFLANECVPQKSEEEDVNEYMKAALAMSTAEIYFGMIVQTAKEKYENTCLCWFRVRVRVRVTVIPLLMYLLM